MNGETKNSDLKQRVVSAVILAPLVIGAMIIGGYVFLGLLALILILALKEWISLSLKTERKAIFIPAGILYLLTSIACFAYLRTGFESGLYFTITMLLVIWASDIGAYFVGRYFGGNHFAPTISPKKTWSGLIGSIIFPAIFLPLCIYAAPFLSGLIPNSIETSHLQTLIALFLAGGVLGYVGQMGDLMESALKRNAQVKDSSNLIPGHGGILDRIDSLLLVAPVFLFICRYVI